MPRRGILFRLRYFAPVLILATALPVVGSGTAVAADPAPASISVTNTWIKEGNATVNASFQVSLSSAPTSGSVTVKVATADISAVAGSDYTAVALTTLTWTTSSALTKTVVVPVLGDTVKEGTETYALNLTAPTGAVIGDTQGVGYIAGDEAPFFISARDVGVTEGNAGTKTMTFTLSLSVAPPTGQSVTVQVATSDGTAVAPGDYTAVTLTTKTFAAGVSTMPVAVTIKGETAVEPNETMKLNLSTPSANAVIADTQAMGTIINDDGTPGAALKPGAYVTNVSVIEGTTAASTTASFTVSLSVAPATGQTIKVNVATANGTATAGSDYTAVPTTTLTFTAGQLNKAVAVTVTGDVLKEPNEAFSLVLSTPVNAVIGDAAGSASIVSEEGPFFAYARNASLTEGNAGTTNLAFTLALSAAPAAGQSASVSVASANGTAVAPGDYAALPLTVKTFGPGVASQAVNVVVNGDTTIEANETLLLNVSAPSTNVIVGDAQGSGTVLDDDAPPPPTVGTENAVGNTTYGSQPGEQGYTSAVAWNGTVNLVVYTDRRSSNAHIYGARVAADGTVLDVPGFLISSASFDSDDPAVVWDGTNFVVVWSEFRAGSGSSDIFGARVSGAGVVLDTTKINIYFGGGEQSEVAIASNGTDSLVTWRDDKDGFFADNIYGRRLSSAGAVIDTAFPISTAANAQFEPAVAWNGTDYFVAWADNRAGTDTYDIYGTAVSSAGVVADAGGIAISTAAQEQYATAITSNGSDFFVAWIDRRSNTSYDIYGTLIDSAGTVLSPSGTLISAAGGDQWNPALAWNGTDYGVVWQDQRGGGGFGNEDLYAARVSAAGAVTDTSGILVASAPYEQMLPALAANGTDFFAVWRDYRNLNYDEYGARITGAGVVQDSSGIRITSGLNTRANSAVAWNGTNFLVVWEDARSSAPGHDIYAARIAADGTVLDPEGIAVSAVATSDQITPAVAWDGTNFLVVWEDGRNFYNGPGPLCTSCDDIYGARVGADGTVLDPDGLVISSADQYQQDPQVAWNGQNYLITYTLASPTRHDIQGAFMGADGGLIANDFNIAADSGGQDYATVASNGTDFLVAWTRAAAQDVYGSRVTAAGAVLAPVAISTATGSQGAVSAAWNGTNYLVAWDDGRTGTSSDIYGTLVSGAGAVIGSPATGIAISTATGNQTAPVIAGDGSGFLVLWNDQRTGVGKFDVYGARLAANGVVTDLTGFAVAVSTAAEQGQTIAQGASGTHLATYTRFSSEAPFNGLDRVYSRAITPS